MHEASTVTHRKFRCPIFCPKDPSFSIFRFPFFHVWDLFPFCLFVLQLQEESSDDDARVHKHYPPVSTQTRSIIALKLGIMWAGRTQKMKKMKLRFFGCPKNWVVAYARDGGCAAVMLLACKIAAGLSVQCSIGGASVSA
jgi:hypothetical protein